MALNHAVAVAMARDAHAGLALLEGLATDDQIVDDHRFHAVRAHLLEMTGDLTGARDSYLAAARRVCSLPQQRYLRSRAALLTDGR